MATTNFNGSVLFPFVTLRFDNVTDVTKCIFNCVGAELNFIFTGTQLSITMAVGSTTPFDIVIDGGSVTNPTIITGVSSDITGTIAEGDHTVSIKLKSGQSITGNSFLIASTAATVTGASPAIKANPLYGASKLARGGNGLIATGIPDIGGAATFFPAFNGSNYQPLRPLAASRGFQGGVLRFRARADKIYVFGSISSLQHGWALYKDGALVGTTNQASSGGLVSPIWTLLGSGLDDGSQHLWEVISCGNTVTIGATGGGGGGNQTADGVMIAGTSAAFDTVSPANRQSIVVTGHSIPAGVDGGAGSGTSTGGSFGVSWPGVLGRLLGVDVFSACVAGSFWSTMAPQGGGDVISAIAAGYITPYRVICQMGRNDTVQATVRTYVGVWLTNILAIPQFTGRVVLPLEPVLSGWTATGALVNAGITQGYNDVASARVDLLDLSDATGYNANDGTHFDQATHTLHATRIYNSGKMTYSASGSSSGGGGGVVGTDPALRKGGYWYGPKHGRF